MASEKVLHVTEETFDAEVLDASNPCLLIFGQRGAAPAA